MIIKCPECGNQVSSRAPVCPTCGVEIAGKIKQCSNCGAFYFTDEQHCPSCRNGKTQTVTQNVKQKPMGQGTATAEKPAKKSRISRPILLTAFFIAIASFATLWYFYNDAQSDKEQDDYIYAVQSSDPEILKSYLLRYPDAPEAHRDTIESHLLKIQKGDEDWTNALLSNSRSMLKKYLDENPESAHRQEALNKIDSLDWIAAQKSNDAEQVKAYAEQHPDGKYIDEATILLSRIMSTMVQESEQNMVMSIFREFFQSVNDRDEERLTATTELVMNNFLGKENATSNDVLTFIRKIYKDDITNMIWRINRESYSIQKTEVAENEYEYDVTFLAQQDCDRSGEISISKYRVEAKVSNEGKISEFNLIPIKGD